MTTGEEQWERLVRRSFGIPDLVSGSMARTAIVGQIAEDFAGTTDPESGAIDAASMVLATVIDLGGKGMLDDCLVDQHFAGILQEAKYGQEPPYRIVSNMSRVGDDAETADRLVRAVDATLQRISRYITDNPFAHL
jgi:hypothetical protein